MRSQKKAVTRIFISLLICLFCANLSLADPNSLLELADSYEQDSNFTLAEATYNQIVTQYPDTEQAFKALKGLTILYIEWDKWSDAVNSNNLLLTD